MEAQGTKLRAEAAAPPGADPGPGGPGDARVLRDRPTRRAASLRHTRHHSAESKESSDVKDAQPGRSRRPGRPSTRKVLAVPELTCKSEPDTELCEAIGEATVLARATRSDEEDELSREEDPPFVDDLEDHNYKPGSGSDEQLSSEEDVPFRDDLNDQSYEPQSKRSSTRPRRRAPRHRGKKEQEKDTETQIKTEGGEEVSVKPENEFGDGAEAPRKRGRRRKDDKSPRLPKRRKKPPVQYVRCEMEGCGTVLAHPRYLQHHIKYQHLLKKKYVCPHPSCGRLFRLQKQLLRHAKHHTDQRDYICEYCARAFKSSHNLAVHRMIHTGEKPLQCEICGFTCRQKASLNWHMKKHDADSFYQFSCNICGKKFEKKDSVVAHKAKSHPEVLIAEALAANAGDLITSPTSLLPEGAEPGEGAEPVLVMEAEPNLQHALHVPVSLTLAPPPVQATPTLHPDPMQLGLAPPPRPVWPHLQEEDDDGIAVVVVGDGHALLQGEEPRSDGRHDLL